MPDLIVAGGKVFLQGNRIENCDILVRDGRIALIGKIINPDGTRERIDATGKLVIPGLIESHFHAGLYRGLDVDGKSESASAAAGGVTTTLNYFRTGKNYLNTSDDYETIMPRLLNLSNRNFYTDYGFNLAPIKRSHVDEIPQLIEKWGISTFKYYMFFRSQKLNLKGEYESGTESPYLLTDDPYDFGHLARMMRTLSKVSREGVRLSIHAEDPEIIRDDTERVKRGNESEYSKASDLEKYSMARSPLAESMGIIQASWLANYYSCPINFLHVSSKDGLDAIRFVRRNFPLLDISVEVTGSHLTLTSSTKAGILAKIHPPIRSKLHQLALWDGIRDGTVNTVASDHCALDRSKKEGDIWSSESAFANVEIMLPTLITNGYFKRGIDLRRLIPMVTSNPAEKFGVSGRKGSISVGKDGDLVILDLHKEKTLKLEDFHSYQNFSPFEGLTMKGFATKTILRGHVVFDGEGFPDTPKGEYLRRPL